ncbi:hypothetical protein M8C21_018231 [Ambrosia artemisiifolia]|uniref:TPX2 central domain-containing protein n=1 Tax=Ambrosia artemisiifolia TaxID=4212 RepID=A0AAD5D800_AMBAR|nr:hypothetical protein M8C21_018231 [Ambrosia artemisiifolia]
MDEDMDIVEDLVADEAFFSDGYDSEYEFDAYHFFDFTRDETPEEADEAQRWFRYAHEYPPSPFLVKLKLMKAAKTNPVKANKKTSTSNNSDGDIDHKAASREMKIKGVKHHHNHMPQDNIKAKPKSTVNLSNPSGSSFMKPTASHLAKQNKECDIHSGGYGRLQKPLVSAVEKLRSPIRIQNQTTKRQKLEIGYLRKAAQLKHRASFLHKVSKKAVQLESGSNSKAKTTIPKKPALVTEERAQSRMSQNKSESLQRPPNRKILDAPKLAQHKKNMRQSNEFQVLHKRNSASPVSEDMIVDRQSSGNAGKKDKCRSPNNLKACTNDKLSLKPEPETKVTSSLKQPHLTKGLKENVPGSYQQEFRRCVGKPNHYGTDARITEVKI